MTSYPLLSSRNRPASADAPAPILLVRARSEAPDRFNEMLDALAPVTGLHPADLRMGLLGVGLAGFRLRAPSSDPAAAVAVLRDFGTASVWVDASQAAPDDSLPFVKHVAFTEDAVNFKDSAGRELLTVDGRSEILLVLADVSGRLKDQLVARLAYDSRLPSADLEAALKKMAYSGDTIADIYWRGQSPVRGIRIQEKHLSYLGLGAEMKPSRVLNFITVIRTVMDRCAGFHADLYFGMAALPKARPAARLYAEAPGEVLSMLDRYGRYLLLAMENGLLDAPPDSAESDAGPAAGTQTADTGGALPPPPEERRLGFSEYLRDQVPYRWFWPVFALNVGGFWLMLAEPAAALQAAPGILVIPLLTSAGLVGCGQSLLLMFHKRWAENTPTSKIRSMSMGTVEVCGSVRRIYDLRTPYSRTRCVYYRCSVYRLRQTQDGRQWNLVKRTDSGFLPFYLADATGKVRVEPDGAAFHITKNRQSFKTEIPNFIGGRSIGPDTEVVEEVIPEGALVYVLGFAKHSAPAAGMADEIRQRLRRLKRDPALLKRYDRNGDGRIDLTEWEAARSDVEHQVAAESLGRPGAGANETVAVGRSPLGGAPFIIADSETALLQRVAARGWLLLCGGLIALGAGVFLLVQLLAGQ